MNYDTIVKEAAATGTRFHPISIEPTSAKALVKMSPPKLPPYNVKQRDVNKVAGYLNRLSARLSIPKLNSSDS